MADLDLIELLNGIDVSSERQRPAFGNSSEVFLDDNGHPTDRLLHRNEHYFAHLAADFYNL
jgi:hypothetical protein